MTTSVLKQVSLLVLMGCLTLACSSEVVIKTPTVNPTAKLTESKVSKVVIEVSDELQADKRGHLQDFEVVPKLVAAIELGLAQANVKATPGGKYEIHVLIAGMRLPTFSMMGNPSLLNGIIQVKAEDGSVITEYTVKSASMRGGSHEDRLSLLGSDFVQKIVDRLP